jgi:hypothetical protein
MPANLGKNQKSRNPKKDDIKKSKKEETGKEEKQS